VVRRPVEESVPKAGTVWVEPKIVCEVEYASPTAGGRLREPVFIRLRPDLMPVEGVDNSTSRQGL